MHSPSSVPEVAREKVGFICSSTELHPVKYTLYKFYCIKKSASEAIKIFRTAISIIQKVLQNVQLLSVLNMKLTSIVCASYNKQSIAQL